MASCFITAWLREIRVGLPSLGRGQGHVTSTELQLCFCCFRKMAQCANCNLHCSDYLCRHCERHQRCVNCQRYLPTCCYSEGGKQCLACTKKPQTRSSVSNIVNEVCILTVHGTESFDALVSSNTGIIDAIVKDYQRHYLRAPGRGRTATHTSIFYYARTRRGPTQHLDLHCVAAELSGQTDQCNARGNGFVLDRIAKFVLCDSQY